MTNSISSMQEDGSSPAPSAVDDAEPVGLALQIGADRDVGLDIHHHQMLAVLHRAQADLGADRGHAGGIDDHVDQAALEQRLHVAGDGDLARFHGRGRASSPVAGLARMVALADRRCRRP